MPTRTKVRKRERRLDDEGWFRLTRDLWRAPGEVLPKLKLVADVNFPAPLVRVLRQRNISRSNLARLAVWQTGGP